MLCDHNVLRLTLACADMCYLSCAIILDVNISDHATAYLGLDKRNAWNYRAGRRLASGVINY